MWRRSIGGLVTAVQLACAGSYESAVRHDLTEAQRAYTSNPDAPGQSQPSAEPSAAPSGDLASYLSLALKHNPELRASFERWRASVHRISEARRLPEPTLGFGYFVRSIETRVGPQRARVSLQQAFPWPTKLTASADAASARARATQRRFDAQALAVSQRVATTYWDLWQVRTIRAIRSEHLDLIRGLSQSVRARVATGAATLAELQQLDLTAARIADNIRGMDEMERAAEARLRALISAPPELPLATTEAPGSTELPKSSAQELAERVRQHPMIESLTFSSEASTATARAAAADRWPSFTLSADWIITGEAAMPNLEDSGRDAVMVGAGLRLPLWQGSYSDSIAAAEAESRSQRADQQALINQAQAELSTTLANLRDAARRAELYRFTLVPQAESAYESVLGAYTVGRGSVAQALLSQRDLLELRIELERARADHARIWARLEELVAGELQRREANSEPEPAPNTPQTEERASPREPSRTPPHGDTHEHRTTP